ncbi:HAD-IA family hydrolase [Burkholderia gladioli]|uniref:HAD-IA family hydrolase n=1 Tax=Burkholderia gladioli TaxID=28095 RepID=UPI000BBD0F30|nr:HAD-IA family hydrolase [Burkholderia gladioli]ATF84387.1 phosphoglycolate phosphatase [Burkholderia gladioli pv. gladioli]MBJ9713027.1 HAD-IA family hydrolase [Burkholderia gladioli]MBU9152998.1 HAD-IA family hydrolase [Burkholderia gladioli]MBU9381905.1 HAD-IA family hydrolase [Burkholderia gladioli]MCH7269604.1 HAD-IA family hydrolase [Burkholderia gladioli]
MTRSASRPLGQPPVQLDPLDPLDRQAGVEAVVFDLDGTLVDTAPDITAAVNRLLATHGLPSQTVRFVEQFIGEGSFGLIDKLYRGLGLHFEPARVAADVETYLAIYRRHPVAHATVYADALAAIPALHAAGLRLGICTNKAQGLALAVLEHFGIARYFTAVVGGDTLAERKPHPRHLLATLEQLEASPSRTLYVGDTRIDAQCADAAGVRCLIVNWGTGPGVPVAAGARLESFTELVTRCAALNAARVPGA